MILKTTTKYGVVSGIKTETEGVTAFKGIPFAAPPIGELRWKAPVSPKPWDGVLKCEEYAPGAYQGKPAVPFYIDEFPIDYSKAKFSEDCLYLNVWTPAKSTDDKLPVLMWIHGGGNEVGFTAEPEFDGEYLASRGVVYVSVAYRLNVFGFLAHPELTAESEYKASGNYGNLDNVAALEWIKENIAAFGGDPDNVTIFGQSAGAMNVHALCSCSFTGHLINRAISMSGSGAASSVGDMSLEQAEALGLEFQKIAGCSSLAELRELSSEEVFQAMKLMGGKERGFSTIRDGYMVKEPFSELVRYGKIHDISYMVGCCSHEGAAFGDGYKQSAAGVNGLINRMFRGHADAVKPLYNVNTDEDAKNCERDLITDGSVYGVNLWGRLQVKNKKKPAYLYLFDRTIPDKDGNPSWEAAFHSGDLWYVHGTIDRSWRGMNEDDRKVSNLMMDYWTNFARSGDPNGEGLPRWTPFTFEERNTMVLNENASMSSLAEYPPIKVLETWK